MFFLERKVCCKMKWGHSEGITVWTQLAQPLAFLWDGWEVSCFFFFSAERMTFPEWLSLWFHGSNDSGWVRAAVRRQSRSVPLLEWWNITEKTFVKCVVKQHWWFLDNVDEYQYSRFEKLPKPMQYSFSKWEPFEFRDFVINPPT